MIPGRDAPLYHDKPYVSKGLLMRGRQKIAIVFFVLIIGAVLWWQYKSPPTLDWSTSGQSATVNELQGLLYRLSTKQAPLPPDLNPDVLMEPAVLAGEPVQVQQWNKQVLNWQRSNPVVVFSKTYCPYSKSAKALLGEYAMRKSPVVIEVDSRADGQLIKSLLTRLTAHSTFPNILVNGKSLGGSDDLTALHESGDLKNILRSVGAL